MLGGGSELLPHTTTLTAPSVPYRSHQCEDKALKMLCWCGWFAKGRWEYRRGGSAKLPCALSRLWRVPIQWVTSVYDYPLLWLNMHPPCSTTWDAEWQLQEQSAIKVSSQAVASHCGSLKLNWQTFNQILHQRQATLVFKVLNNLAPRYMNELFSLASANTTHSLRLSTFNKLSVCIPRAHPKSLTVYGPKIWNSLSLDTHRAKTIGKFRTEYAASHKI